jgi:hypothetical protein
VHTTDNTRAENTHIMHGSEGTLSIACTSGMYDRRSFCFCSNKIRSVLSESCVSELEDMALERAVERSGEPMGWLR